MHYEIFSRNTSLEVATSHRNTGRTNINFPLPPSMIGHHQHAYQSLAAHGSDFLPQNKIYINFLGFEAALASSQRVAPPSLSSLYGNTILAEPCALLSNATLSTNKQNKNQSN